MAITVNADTKACQGYGDCVIGADDVFDIDDSGTVVVLKDAISVAGSDRVEKAARSCARNALLVS